MDFRNLCNKIDVESIKAKLPHMPAMPQIKFPKSMSKLKSRKIFSRSREDVNKGSPRNSATGGLSAGPPPIPPADFIKRTPARISTISSLIQKHTAGSRRDAGGKKRKAPQHEDLEGNDNDYDDTITYRSADSIDDYPLPSSNTSRTTNPISPIKVPRSFNSSTNNPTDESTATVKMSFTEKLQKGYKDFTEFRLTHILAKKTVVRKDNIEVDYYVKHYNEDRIAEEREQARRDQLVAENYRFKFKESRQNTGHSNSVSPMESPIAQKVASGKAAKSVSEQSGDESGMETSPPKRSPGIAVMRFAKVRNPPLSQSSKSFNSSIEADDHEASSEAAPNSSTLWAIKENKNNPTQSNDAAQSGAEAAAKSKKGYKERLRRLTSQMSTQEETDKEDGGTVSAESGAFSRLRNFGKRQNSKEELDEDAEATKAKSQQSLNEKVDNSLDAIKQNIKRFKSTMSLKRQPTPVATNDTDDESSPTVSKSKASGSPQKTTKDKLVARLSRFKSRDEPQTTENESSPKKTEISNTSPIRTAINNKLQTWKKSFKRKPNEANEAETGTDGETSPEKQQQPKRSSTLVKKLKYIRSRKNASNSNDELDTAADSENDKNTPEKGASGTSSNRKSTRNFEEKFENVRQRTLKKVNDKMQKMKFFQRSQEQMPKDSANTMPTPEDNEANSNSTSPNIPSPTLKRRRGAIQSDYELDSEMDDDDDIEEINNIQEHLSTTQKIHAVWTTKPILSDSTESEDNDTEYPRVLIHQDNSDLYESTLIIAVTTSAPQSPMAKLTEITTTPPPRKASLQTAKAIDWIPNREIISSFLEITPPSVRRSHESNIEGRATPTIRRHARKLSIDSNSDSDSWIPETARNKPQNSSRDDTRRASALGLNIIQENEEPWRVQFSHTKSGEDKLYKSKSIDIFEAHAKHGGATAAFENFDDELKNEPILKIRPPPIKSNSDNESYGKDSSEDQDTADDDNSSRVTKIRVQTVQEDNERVRAPIIDTISDSTVQSTQRQQFGNSRESLDANFDENEELYTDDSEDDRPPSSAPSPPPSFSPPPPPLPARQPSIRLTQLQSAATVSALAMASTLPARLPPLPISKPPILPPPPPTQQPPIPERTESMSRISKPLVKTSSLRLAYTEQVKPSDVGKVNKLISRFEQPNGTEQQSEKSTTGNRRPRVVRRTMLRESSEDYTEDDDDDEHCILKKNLVHVQINDSYNNNNRPTPKLGQVNKQDSLTIAEEPTKVVATARRMAAAPAPTATQTWHAETVIASNDIENNNKNIVENREMPQEIKANTKLLMTPVPEFTVTVPKISLKLDNNNRVTQSRPSSEYGSPLEYPSSLIGSTETTPTPDRRQELRAPGRRLRSKTNEDDQYYSFDSDEENSYYSISSTSSSRYVVEI